MDVELDLRQVRAFVAAAGVGHFGRAAASLAMTQQGLSKRIAGLEDRLGGAMFLRGADGVTLTERGQRFLPAAHRLLEAANHAAVVGSDGEPPSLRVDVWGPIDPPRAVVRAFAAEHPSVVVEVSMRRDLSAALGAVARNELDVALGNLAHFEQSLAPGLSSRRVAVTELAALVRDDHDLARQSTIGSDDVRRYGIAVPAMSSRHEFGGYATEYAEALGAPTVTAERNAELDDHVDRMSADPGALTLVAATWSPPADSRLGLLAIRPAPLFPWHAVWRTATPHPRVSDLVRFMGRHASGEPVTPHWLPASERESD